MKKIASIIITYMISTTLVLAQHTFTSAQSDLNQVFAQIENVNQYQKLTKSTNSCESIDKKELIKKIDKRIAKAHNSNETLEESLEIETKKYKKLKVRQSKMVRKILKRNRRIKRAYKKVKKQNPEITRAEFVANLKESIKPSTLDAGISELTEILTSAGSMESYLLNIKSGLNTCKNTFVDGNAGMIYLIIFVGVPVLSILVAIFALLFGLFSLALWLFVGAVAILIVFIVIGNLSSKLLSVNEQEFELYLQPIFEADSEDMHGAEVLIRWPQSDGSFVSPDLFIGIAEQSGLILGISKWVVLETINHLKKLKVSGKSYQYGFLALY